MKNLFLLLCFVFVASQSYGQFKVISTGENKALHPTLTVGEQAGSATTRVQIGKNRTATGAAGFELYSDGAVAGLQFNRFASGLSSLVHRGSNVLQLNTVNGAPINFLVSSAVALRVAGSGDIGIGTASPTAKLSVNGTANKPGGGDWGMFSDKLLKNNVQTYEAGLAEVLQINPVTYNYNGLANIEDTDKLHIGIVAQELQKIAPYMVSEVPVTEVIMTGEGETYKEELGETNNYLHVDATGIRYMLVNAIKEQQLMIENQAEKIAILQEAISGIGSSESINNTSITLSTYDLAELDQNTPNPFRSSTTIAYIVPTDAQNAEINVYGQNGQLMKSLTIDHVGQGTLTVNAEDLPSGTYSYQLVVNGRNIQTNTMVITK